MKIGLLGFGTVGKGVYDIIDQDFDDIFVKYVLVKHQEKHQDIKSLLVDSIDDILSDDEIEVIIETIGGTDDAYEYVGKALEKHKHVITANKALISKHFNELEKLASKHRVSLRYEASVGAAIIIIDPLKTIRDYNHIYQIEGIINGSTNYILSKIFLDNYKLEDALKEAHQLGYIESNPKDDMDGFDLLRKIHILSQIAYREDIDTNMIKRIPLSSITQEDIDTVKKQDKIIKYIASSKKDGSKIEIEVKPIIIDKTHPYAKVNYEDNIIHVFGEYHKKQTFIGTGAGRYPTASAIIYDLLKIKATNEKP